MMVRLIAALVACVTLSLLPTAAFATDVCAGDPLHANNSGRKVTYLNLGQEGPLVGDRRIGEKDLFDKDGNKVGRFRWIATVVSVGNSRLAHPTYAVDKFYELEDGILFGASVDNTTSPVSDTTVPSVASGLTTITGGVGRYAGATGVMAHKRAPESGEFTYTFLIECP